jgi:spore coat protein A, manganese oxidase
MKRSFIKVISLIKNEDDHPIHIHLVQFQILDRHPFDVAAFKKSGQNTLYWVAH